jgi:hypothetical protein
VKSVKLKTCRFCGCQRVWPCLGVDDANICPEYFAMQSAAEAAVALEAIGEELPANVSFTRKNVDKN